MNVSLHNRIRRTGLVVLVVSAVAVIGAGPARALDRPAASFYTPQQLQQMSQSWAAKARVSLGLPVRATPSSLDRPAASFYTPQQIQQMSQSWAAKARVSLQRQNTSLRSSNGSRFDWGDFGIGAAAMLGLVLLASGLVAGAHYGRKSGVRARPVS